MLFSLGHGKRILQPSDHATESSILPGEAQRLASVVLSGKSPTVEMGMSVGSSRSFGYFFPDAEGVPDDGPDTINALKNLAAAMTEPAGDPEVGDSTMAPVFTYFGQFIDHDITANTDRDALTVKVSDPALPPRERDFVVDNIGNLRNGSLRLDSLYGEGLTSTEFTEKVRLSMRDPSDRAKMRLGPLADAPGAPSSFPDDLLADLPRLGDVLDDPESGLSIADIEGLSDDEFKVSFFNADGTIKRARAVIGDGRNDENLLVAQLHVAFLRFHNAVSEELKATVSDVDQRFEAAKRKTIWIYQWLVLNVYLGKICQTSVVEAVKLAEAPLYTGFIDRVASDAPAPGVPLPMPLEFSVAAFRFGHSMVRGSYDYNSNFGRPGHPSLPRPDPTVPHASFAELFSFTGGDNLGQQAINQSFDRLPANWVIDWDRFAKESPNLPDHRARKIDTKIAPPLFDMFKESVAGGELERILRNLAERNLRRSHLLNIPTGQAVVDSINLFDDTSGASIVSGSHKVDWKEEYKSNHGMPDPESQDNLVKLSESILSEGPVGQALASGNMLANTPLWYYCLREAEVTAGDTLGPLGSRLIAETLVGLVVADPESYWHQGGGNGSWTPAVAPVGGSTISDISAMLQTAGLMQ